MHRALRAIVGGAVGTGIMLVILLIGEAQSRFLIGTPAAIARFVGMPGRIYVGFLVFILAGVLLWPLVFIAVNRVRPIPDGGDAAVRGMLFAVVLWIAFVILGSGDQSGAILVLYLVFTLLAHLAYGFTLGAIFARLAESDVERGAGAPAR